MTTKLTNQQSHVVSTKALDDEWLQIQAAVKDPAAFKPLYEKYYHKIFRFIHRRTNDEFVSADVCSKVFLKAMNKLHNYKFKGVPFSAWLYRISSNEVNQYFRNSNKRRVVSLDEVDLTELFESEDGSNQDKIELMLVTLQELELKDMEIIEMRFFEKRSFREIAEILGISESNSKVRTYRVLEKLRRKMVAKMK